MPQYVNAQNLIQLYQKDANQRSNRLARRVFYDAKNDLPSISGQRRLDGHLRTTLNINFVRMICDSYSGYMNSKGISFSAKAGTDTQTKDALNQFSSIYSSENLSGIDSTHIRDSILFGSSVEVYSLKNGELDVESTDPLSWSFVRDEEGHIVTGIYHQKIEKGNVFQGQLLDKDLDVYYVYDDQSIRTYSHANSVLTLINEAQNFFDGLPLTEFYVSPCRHTSISDSILHQVVEHNSVLSSLIDGVKYNVSSLLHMKGVKMDDLLMKDKDGNIILDQFRTLGIFPSTKPDTELKFVERNLSLDSFQYTLMYLRKSICDESAIPDISLSLAQAESKAMINSISATALAMAYLPMENRCCEYDSYFAECLRERMKKFSSIWTKVNNQVLDPSKVNIKVNHSIPRSLDTLLQYLPSFKGIISLKDMLNELPFINNVEQSLEQLKTEQSALNNSNVNNN